MTYRCYHQQQILKRKKYFVKQLSAGRALAQLNGKLLSLPNPTLFLDSYLFAGSKGEFRSGEHYYY